MANGNLRTSVIDNVYHHGTLNSQWNANGGIFGVGPTGYDGYVQVTSTPSFFGSSVYNINNSSFSAQVTVAPTGNGSTQTSLVIKADENNYAEMFVGPGGIFGAYVAINSNPQLPTTPFPVYNPVTHAFWRIRNDGIQFFFDASPDGITWTLLGQVSYDWAIQDVTVMFLAGFTGNEADGMKAYINNVNGNFASTQIKSTASGISRISGRLTVSESITLLGEVHGFSNITGRLLLVNNLPQGGLTDFAVADSLGDDGAKTRLLTRAAFNVAGGPTRTYVRPYIGATAPAPYRDGSYWKQGYGLGVTVGATTPDTNNQAFTNVQVERTPSQQNRLSVTASYYTDSCEYVAQKSLAPLGQAGSTNVSRSSEVVLAGNYSGKMIFSGVAVNDGEGNPAYWPFPTRNALVQIINNVAGQEIMRGSVSISTTRTGTVWYPSFVFYDANFNILSASTYQQVTVPNKMTHPGSGVWQTGSIIMPFAGVANAVWVGIVPVILNNTGMVETIYMSGHSIVSITPHVTAYPTTYVDPKRLTIELKADRVNLAKNSGFVNSAAGWTLTAGQVNIVTDAVDTFTRTVSNGWGSAPTGGAWTTAGGVAADYSVTGTAGAHSLTAVSSSRRTTLTTAATADQDIRVGSFINVAPLGNSVFAASIARGTDDNNQYLFRVAFDVGGGVTISIRKRVASVETQLAAATAPFLYSVMGVRVFTRFYVHGSTLQAKAWLEGTIEPANWMLTTTDTSFATGAQVGCRSVLNAGNTNTLPYSVLFDNFSLNNFPASVGWDGTIGFNSVGSLKVSVIPPTPASSSTSPDGSFGTSAAFINNTSLQFPVITGLIPNTTYTISAYVRPGTGCPNIYMKCLNPNYEFAFVINSNDMKSQHPELFTAGWIRMFATFTVPPNGPGDYSLNFEVHFDEAKVAAPFDYWVDSILVEKGELLNSYFDGNSSSADFQYEKAGNSLNRSYYYTDLSNKLARLKLALPDYSPYGSTANIIYAQSP